MVLVGGDRDEGRLVEDMGTVGRVLGSKSIVFICFDDVESRLVLVHRVQDDLEEDIDLILHVCDLSTALDFWIWLVASYGWLIGVISVVFLTFHVVVTPTSNPSQWKQP